MSICVKEEKSKIILMPGNRSNNYVANLGLSWMLIMNQSRY